MSKILKNTTGSAIFINEIGQEVPASGQITVAEVDYLKLSSPDSVSQLDPLITSGDIVVNNGVEDLSISVGQYFIRYPDTSNSIYFSNGGDTYRDTTKTVNEALEEIRQRTVTSPEITAGVASTDIPFDENSNTFQIITGTATGVTVTLPDATLLPNGVAYEVYNSSSQPIVIRSYGGSILVTLNSDSLGTFKLEDSPNAAGSWIFTITSTTADGILSYVVTSGTLFITSSITDDLITGFSVQPASGRYSAFLSADIDISANNRIADGVFYADGVAIENTRRKVQGVSSNFQASMQSIGEITVDGTEVVDVRVAISSGTLTISQRSFILIRLGSI